MKKTNAMRLLDRAKIAYDIAEYEVDENDLSGIHVAETLGQSPYKVFKTLVLKGEKAGYLVLCIPVKEEVDLKKAAKAAGEKKVEMIHMKDLLSVTGYIRGGCSPIGMKKQYRTFIHESACAREKIAVSAGVRGAQIIIEPGTLKSFIRAEFADLIRS